jgi:hypothetical protein
MTYDNQKAWPRVNRDGSERNSPTGFFQGPTALLKSGRSLAGPLRMGTEPRVGPSGPVPNGSSDLGMDRISPRGFDPMGTALSRYGQQESSSLISQQVRRNR